MVHILFGTVPIKKSYMPAKHHLLALGVVIAGVALEALAYIGNGNGILRGAGAVMFMVRLVVEIIGIAMY